MNFEVEVERRYYQLGKLQVEAESMEEAVEIAIEEVDHREFPICADSKRISWNEITPEMGSFNVSQDNDETDFVKVTLLWEDDDKSRHYINSMVCRRDDSIRVQGLLHVSYWDDRLHCPAIYEVEDYEDAH